MKSSFAAVLAAVAGASAWADNVTYTTEVVTAITTICPVASTFAHAGTTYTASEGETLTIPGPATITRPVYTITTTSCESTATAIASSAPIPYSNGTATLYTSSSPVGTGSPGSPGSSTTGSSTTTSPPIATAGAGKTAVLSGGALAGVLGLAAFLL